MSNAPLKLASEFPAVRRQDWIALVDKALAGKDFDSVMQKQSYDGIPIDALYTKDNARVEAQIGISEAGWDICQPYWGADVGEANVAFLRDLEHGATTIAFRMAAGGFSGLPINGFERVLDGVHLNMCAVQLIADEEFDAVGRAYLDLLRARGVAANEARGTLGADPISTLAATGRLLTSLDSAVEAAANLACETAKQYPHISTFNVAGHTYHSAGASEAIELAACLSIGVRYLRAMEEAGIDIQSAANQIEFTMAADADIYLTTTKFRALRRLWAKVLQASGVEDVSVRINAVTAARMMSARDPWVNILRGTAACFAAGVGGANSITILPFDTMLGLPTRFSRRIARNIQVILQEESYLSQVADPTAGAYAFETITTDLTRKAWEEFQKFEAGDGFVACLKSGALSAKLTETWRRRKIKLDNRQEPLTGVSEFPNIHEKMPEAGDMPAFVEDIKPAGESLEPLTFHRSAEDFEALRSFSDKVLAEKGARPSVFLANLGSVAQHTARAMFAKNFFEAGGIEAHGSDGFDGVAALVQAFADSRSDMAVICGSDALYESEGEVIVTALKDAGCKQIYLAGRPANAKSLAGTGVTDFIFMGSDVLSILQRAMTLLGDKS